MAPSTTPVDEDAEGYALFVNDFVGVDVGVDVAVQAFGGAATPGVVRDLVLEAWRAEVAALDAALAIFGSHQEPMVEVEMGPARWRRDAVVIPMRWWTRAGEWIPPLEADLELAAFGPDRTHVHVLGRSRLPAGEPPQSQTSSIHQRFTVALVRHVLCLLSDRVLAPNRRTNLG